MSSQLHVALQRHYAGEGGLVEAQLDGYRVDVLRDNVVYEIQTGSFSSTREKLAALSKTHAVVLVYPIPQTKIIVRIDPRSGEQLSARRSPKRGAVTDVFDELMYLAAWLRPDSVSLEVVLTVERELRRDDGRGSWRRKRVSLAGRELVEIVATQRFDRPTDFLRLLPLDLPECFTVADLAEAMPIGRRLAGKMAYALRQLAAIEHVGKQANAFLYRRADES